MLSPGESDAAHPARDTDKHVPCCRVEALHSKPETLNPNPYTLNPKLQTLILKSKNQKLEIITKN